MPKSKPTKLQAFFEGRRRKAMLVSWAHLKTRAGESRVKLDLKLPLLNEDVIGMPEAISAVYMVMAKDDSRVERTNLNIFYAGMTIEGFTTESNRTSRVPSFSATGVMMTKFAIVAQGEGEKREVNLQCVVYMPANVTMRDWAWEHLHGQFFMESAYSQTEMEFESESSPEEDEDEEEAEDQDEEEESEDQPEPSGEEEAVGATKEW